MSRNEKFSTYPEISRVLCQVNPSNSESGPILCVRNGKILYFPSDAHIKITGNTGTGKSKSVSIPFVRNIIDVGKESAVIVDPKGEIYSETAGYVKDHKVYVLDFRSPASSPDRINILELPYKNIKSKYTTERDTGRSQIRSMLNVLLPEDNHSDPFWPQAGRRLLSGCLYGMMEKSNDPSEITLNSLAVMMSEAEADVGSGIFSKPRLKEFYDSLGEDSFAKRDLTSYVYAAKETKLSIFSVASNALAEISNSEGLLKLLSYEPTIHLDELDLAKPFLFYIIMPDEDSVYTKIIGIIVTMFTQKLIQRAQDEFDGSLPVRTNVLLEEIGSIGNAIPNLPNLMSASRSRNMRMTVCCQSDQQLTDVYGAAKAAVIESCFGATVAFSTNDEDQLKRLSVRLGERTVTVTDEMHTYTKTEPLLTPNQIRAMPVGTALVFLGNNIKFVSNLHMYRELYPDIKPVKLNRSVEEERLKLPCFSLLGYLGQLEAERKEKEEKERKEQIETYKRNIDRQLRRLRRAEKNRGLFMGPDEDDEDEYDKDKYDKDVLEETLKNLKGDEGCEDEDKDKDKLPDTKPEKSKKNCDDLPDIEIKGLYDDHEDDTAAEEDGDDDELLDSTPEDIGFMEIPDDLPFGNSELLPKRSDLFRKRHRCSITSLDLIKERIEELEMLKRREGFFDDAFDEDDEDDEDGDDED